MGVEGWVEGDNGQIEHIVYPNGWTGGKPIYAFIMGLLVYCDAPADPDYEWYQQLELPNMPSLCDISNVIRRAIWAAAWDYKDEDYERYVREWGAIRPDGIPMTPEIFAGYMRDYRAAYAEIPPLIEDAERLLARVQYVNPPEHEAWYHPDWLPDALAGLIAALKKLQASGVHKAALMF